MQNPYFYKTDKQSIRLSTYQLLELVYTALTAQFPH